MLRSLLGAVVLLVLLAQSSEAKISKNVPDVKSLHAKRHLMGSRHHYQNATDVEGSLRIKKAQVDLHAPKPPTKIRRALASSLPTYDGPQPDTRTCTNNGGSDGCTTPYYTVSSTGVTLVGTSTYPASGHVNFQYISCSDYKGVGSKADQPSYWNVLSGGLHFDPNNNQPGGAYIGKSYFPFSAGTSLPGAGYCVIWVQVSTLNQHYGEGGQGPVCQCSTGSGAAGAATTSTMAATSSSTSMSTSTSASSSTSTSASTSSTSTPIGTQSPYGQCGGIGYTGATGCTSGWLCTKANDYYSQCLPAPIDTSCKQAYEQCGGIGYSGKTCCSTGYKCSFSSAYWSACTPA